VLVHPHRHVAFAQHHDARQQQSGQVHHVLPLDPRRDYRSFRRKALYQVAGCQGKRANGNRAV
jgi:hypothetical protein